MSNDADYDSVLREYTWTLLVLLYFAASDGAIKPPEGLSMEQLWAQCLREKRRSNR
jgi:hypothetical protein